MDYIPYTEWKKKFSKEKETEIIQPSPEFMEKEGIVGETITGIAKDIGDIGKIAWHTWASSWNDIAEKVFELAKYNPFLIMQRIPEVLDKSEWSKEYREQEEKIYNGISKLLNITKNEEYLKLAKAEEKEGLVNQIVGETIGGLGPGIAEWFGNVPWAMWSELSEQRKKENPQIDKMMAHTLFAGLKRFLLGKVFSGLHNLPAIKKVLGGALIGLTDYTAEVVTHTDMENFVNEFSKNYDINTAIKSAATLGILQALGRSKRDLEKYEEAKETIRNGGSAEVEPVVETVVSATEKIVPLIKENKIEEAKLVLENTKKILEKEGFETKDFKSKMDNLVDEIKTIEEEMKNIELQKKSVKLEKQKRLLIMKSTPGYDKYAGELKGIENVDFVTRKQNKINEINEILKDEKLSLKEKEKLLKQKEKIETILLYSEQLKEAHLKSDKEAMKKVFEQMIEKKDKMDILPEAERKLEKVIEEETPKMEEKVEEKTEVSEIAKEKIEPTKEVKEEKEMMEVPKTESKQKEIIEEAKKKFRKPEEGKKEIIEEAKKKFRKPRGKEEIKKRFKGYKEKVKKEIDYILDIDDVVNAMMKEKPVAGIDPLMKETKDTLEGFLGLDVDRTRLSDEQIEKVISKVSEIVRNYRKRVIPEEVLKNYDERQMLINNIKNGKVEEVEEQLAQKKEVDEVTNPPEIQNYIEELMPFEELTKMAKSFAKKLDPDFALQEDMIQEARLAMLKFKEFGKIDRTMPLEKQKSYLKSIIHNAIRQTLKKERKIRAKEINKEGTVYELLLGEEDEVSNKFRQGGYITDFGIGDWFEKIKTTIEERRLDREILNEFKKEVSPKQLSQKYKLDEKTINDIIRIKGDITKLQEWMSFAETLGSKHPTFKNLFDELMSIIQKKTKMIVEMSEQYNLHDILKQFRQNDNYVNALLDIKYKIPKKKWTENYFLTRGLNLEQARYLASLIKNNPRELIYKILHSSPDILKKKGYDVFLIEHLKKFAEEEKNILKEENFENIFKNYGLNEEETQVLLKFKNLNDYVYKKVLDNFKSEIDKKYADKEITPALMKSKLVELKKLQEFFTKHYDPFYFNKERIKKRWIIQMSRGSEERPIIKVVDTYKEAQEIVSDLESWGYKQIETANGEKIPIISRYKKPKFETYDIPIELLSEINLYDPTVIKDIVGEGEIVGFWKHLQPAFYIADEGIDLSKNTSRYINSFTSFIARREVKEPALKLVKQIMKEMPETNLARAAERLYKDVMQPQTNIFNKIMAYAGVYYLGFNIKAHSLQMTQPTLVTLPYMTGKWGLKKSLKHLIKGYELAIKYVFDKENLKKTNPEIFEAVEIAKNDGRIFKINEIEMLKEMSRSSFFDKFVDKTMIPFNKLDEFQRLISFLAGYLAEQKTDVESKIKTGIEVSQETNFNYTNINRPAVAKGLLSPFFALRIFEGNQYRLLKKYLTNKQWKSLTTQLAVSMAWGGIKGIPFSYLGLSVLNQLGINPSYYIKKFFYNASEAMEDLIEWLPDLRPVAYDVSDVALQGIPSLAGFNISSSVAMGRFMPDILTQDDLSKWLVQLLGIPADITNRGWKTVRSFLIKDRGKDWYKLLPNSLYNIVRAWLIYQKGLGKKREQMIKPGNVYLSALRAAGYIPNEQDYYYNYMLMKKSGAYSKKELNEYLNLIKRKEIKSLEDFFKKEK